MSKVDIKRLDSVTKNDTTATKQINDNFQALQAAIENTVSRDGTVPNYMDADLDLNSYRIINAGDPVGERDVVTLKYFEEKAGGAIEAAAEAKTSASKAASSAQSALVASNNAIGQLAQAEGLLTAAVQYVNAAKADINTAVDEASTDISNIVSNAEDSITNIAVTEANKAIANAAQEATDTATANVNSYVDGTVKPSLQTYVDQAQEKANSAATSMEQAALSATAASNYASNASADADNAANSAAAAKVSENNAKASETNAKIWADGTDSEVQALGGVHSSKGWSEIAKDSLPPQAGNDGKFLTTDGTEASWADVGGGLEIGDIGFAPLGIDEAQNKRRYLNGQVISQAQFVSFTNKIKAAIQLTPSLATTETNWQAEVTNSKLGQCGKFVIDDTAGTIRLPKVVNIQGLQDLSLLGGIKAESLPNIKGISGSGSNVYKSSDRTPPSGAFAKGIYYGPVGGGGDVQLYNTSFNASRSSSTYKDNAPVQQEAVQYPYYIQVATGVEESVDVTREIELNNPFSLLDYKWSEYELSNASWLLSNGAFHSGTVYTAVYELLLKIKNGTVTKDGVSVKLSTEAYTDTDFVINTTNQTFRLPIKVKLASGSAVVGNGMTLGLTDGKINQGLDRSANGAFVPGINAYGSNVGTVIQSGGGDVCTYGITTDPTKSGIETSSSGLKLYFYVGETIQDANVIAASQVLTKVANGIDRTVATDRETVVGWGMPDYSAGVGLNSNVTYTAEKDGFVFWQALNVTRGDFFVNDVLHGQAIGSANHWADCNSVMMPVSKGDTYKCTGANSFIFYPFKGVN